MDSTVGLSSLVKGRSPSHGLRRALRRAGTTVIAGCIYPAFQFGPTRLLPADHPTRDTNFPESCASILEKEHGENILRGLASVVGLRRVQSNWVRLFLLIVPHWPSWWTVDDSWRYAHLSYKAYPSLGSQVRRGVGAGSWIFDDTWAIPEKALHVLASQRLPLGVIFVEFFGFHGLCGIFGFHGFRGLPSQGPLRPVSSLQAVASLLSLSPASPWWVPQGGVSFTTDMDPLV